MPYFEKLLRNAISLTPSYSNDSEPKAHPLEKQYFLNRYLSNNALHYRTRECDSVAGQRWFIGSYYRTGERDSVAISDLIQSLRPARQVQYPLGWTAGVPKATRQSDEVVVTCPPLTASSGAGRRGNEVTRGSQT